ncbi:MAG: hypothetical protein ACKVW3_14860 [Phycisphaerales bacterium]
MLPSLLAGSLTPCPLLAWRPFLDPLSLNAYWWAFLVPLAMGVAFSYRAVRMKDLSSLTAFGRQVIIMTWQIVAAMVMLGAGVFVFLEYVLPRIAPMP